MFGHNTEDQTNAPAADTAAPDATATPAPAEPTSAPAVSDSTTPEYIMPDPPATATPAQPVDAVDDGAATEADDNPVPTSTLPPAATSAPSAASDDLINIKQQALQQLTPLVDHLDQSPEEKFRTTMMMIQASDNDALIKVAYDAAQSITDEKTRAQALLDIVNEINYFTQNQAS
ncbi:MAG TPA: hypothetical protein VLG11_06125 [Candidatus Saccharimonadales bacterium]|nr:hypothetical protein [Candidatus Saccharimonadales bacterium]